MGDWLTTGKMIDRLKVGEVAECTSHDLKVIKTVSGKISHVSELGNLVLNFHTTDAQWRILPNYVSFGEAMDAIKNGKTVRFYFGKDNPPDYIRVSDRTTPAYFNKNTSWNDLINGKWTIEDDVE